MAIRILPVIDLRSGQAVHARGGRRECYQNVRTVFHEGSDPLGLALAFRDVFGLSEVYLADLDAIAGAPADLPLIRKIVQAGVQVWVDLGLKDASQIDAIREAGASTIIAATETLTGPVQLREIVDRAGADRVVFGLDFRGGNLHRAPGSDWPSDRVESLIDSAIEAGVNRFLLLDTERVGSGRGVGGLDEAAALIRRFPQAEVTLGGGVNTRADLVALEALGVSTVLVGSALHDGRITPVDVQELGTRVSGPEDHSTCAD